MFKLIALTLFVVAVSANTAPRHRFQVNEKNILGDQQFRGGRIVGGRDTAIEEFPYTTALFYRRGRYCGSSLLNQNTVLSAAHCTHGLDLNNFQVLAGFADIRNTQAIIDTVWVMEHPEYDDWMIENDLVILRLDRNIIFNDQKRYINLPTPNFQITPGNIAVVTGWGDLSYEEQLGSPDILQSVEVPVLSNAQCQVIYNQEEILPQHLCAGTRGRDACFGDSGGPLQYNGIQIGVVSWGYGCALEWPTVYARVSEFLGFITQQMNRP